MIENGIEKPNKRAKREMPSVTSAQSSCYFKQHAVFISQKPGDTSQDLIGCH